MPLDWSQHFLRSARGRLVARLRRAPATVEQLAAGLGLTSNGVRAHLATLERDGWIHAAGSRRPAGAGKPATLYALSPAAEPLLSTAYRPLLVALLGALAESERPAKLRLLLRKAGRRVAGVLEGGGKGSLVDRAVRVLELLGGAVETTEGRKGSFEVRGLGCPVAEAVAAEPHTCQAVSALLAGALGAKVVARCDRHGPPRCRFEVTPRS